MNDYLFLIGLSAAILTTSAFIPQVIKAHVTKRTQDLSFAMYLVFSLGLALWTIYGIALHSIPIILANTLTLMMSLYLLYLKVRNG